MNTGFRVAGWLLLGAAAAWGEMRTWTFEQSGATMQGEVVGFTGGAVVLKRPDGKTVQVQTAYFSAPDRAYLETERANQWKEVEIVKLEGAESGGLEKKCRVEGKGVSGEIYVELLPAGVEAVLNQRSQQNAQITSLTDQVAGENQAVRQAKAAVPSGTPHYRGYGAAARARRAEAKQEASELKTSQTNLAGLQKAYDDYVKKTKDQTTVKMRKTGREYKGLPVWECFDPRRPQQ